MPNLFRPGANTAARASLFLLAALPWVVIWAGSSINSSSFNTKVGDPIDQPVPFSHNHHAFELGIDCRFCHASVEKSGFAGIPPTQTCMTCHSQIWTNSPALEPVRKSWETGEPLEWNRVNWLPDFVYFNHSIHIARGLNCNNCHGPVQKMNLTWKGKQFKMAWCLECHRNPEKFLYQDSKNDGTSPQDNSNNSLHDQVFNLYWKHMEKPDNELSDRERSLLNGTVYSPTNEEKEQGLQLIKKLNVKVSQLADCYICHR